MSGAQLIRTTGIVVMKLWRLLYTIGVLISAVIFRPRYARCTGSSEELERRIIALYKAVDFMARRPHQMNVDSIFGLTMTEAHILPTINHYNMQFFDPDLRAGLLDILLLCQRARRRAMARVTTRTYGSAMLNRMLNQPDIWMQPIHWSSGSLGPKPMPTKNITQASVVEYFFKGTPDEAQSDRCIAQLADAATRSVCVVSDYCADMLLRNDAPKGYPLTHRLLYVQTAIALGCKEHAKTPFEKLIPLYCAGILQDAVDIEAANFPTVSRDMICEQVLLCGMKGYTEFANDHYARLILSWPNTAGCFSTLGFEEGISPRGRTKRESEKMDFGCDNHATGLGAASLSLLIRNFVERIHSKIQELRTED